MERELTRRRLLGALCVGGATLTAGCSQSAPPGGGTGGTESVTAGGTAATGTAAGSPSGPPDAVALETLATGLQAPVDVAFAPDADRRYVADQPGQVYVHDADELRDEPFLDLGDAVEVGGEMGLLGLELHPDFAENRRLFVRYSAPRRDGTPDSYNHTFVLAEFAAADDGTSVRPDSETALLEIPEPQSNHNAGSIAFGPDGLLYVGVGDGGGSADEATGHVDDWYDAVDGGNGQDVTENLLGSILRIDVDGGVRSASGGSTSTAGPTSTGGGSPAGTGYAIPDDNPLVGREGLDEHYAWGFRNPWRFSFDGETLFVADVGENRYEEVSVVERGGNYGWNVKEGTHCFEAGSCPDRTPGDVRGGEPLVDPILEYPHSGAEISGVSVIGGYVYRGSALPGLDGRYVFADLDAGGRLFVASRPDGDGLWPTAVLDVADADAGKIEEVLSFGRDTNGEVYVLGIGENGGGFHRIIPAE